MMDYANINIREVYQLNIIEYLNYADFCKSEILEHNAREMKRQQQIRGRRK